MAIEDVTLEASIGGVIGSETMQTLRVGSVLESARKVGQPAILYADGQPKFEGHETVEDVAGIQVLGIEISDWISQAAEDGLKDMNFRIRIGSTQMPIEGVLKLGNQSLVRLDRLRGGPVDLLIDGELYARGDVVVIRDTFGIRITELISPSSGSESSGPNASHLN